MIIENNTTFENLIRSDFNFEILPTRSGKHTIIYQGNLLHSKYDPDKEAENIADIPNPANTSIIFVMGVGLGYHVGSIMRKMAEYPCTIVLFEKNPEFIFAAKKLGYLDYLDFPNIILICGEDSPEDFYYIAEKFTPDVIKGYRIIQLLPCIKTDNEFYSRVLFSINEVLSAKFIDSFTRYELERRWIKNTIENSPAMFNNLLKMSSSLLPDSAAMIISAGPSLKLYLNAIKEVKEHFTLFVVDTALGSVLEADIIPDYVVTLDSQIHNEKDFYTAVGRKKELNLVCGASVYPGVKKFADNLYFFSVPGENRLIPILEEVMGISIEKVDTEISVSYSAIQLAIMCGFTTLYLAGQDLDYTGGITHSPGCPVYNLFLYSSDKLNPVEKKFYQIIRKRKSSRNGTGKPDLLMEKLAVHLENFIAQKDITIYNLSCGRDIKGTKKLNPEIFAEAARKFKKRNKPILERISIPLIKLLPYYELLLKNLQDLKERIRRTEIKDFENLQEGKAELEKLYPFLKSYFQQDDLYLKRKEELVPEKKISLYMLSLLNRITSLEKSIQRVIDILKSADHPEIK